MLRSSNEPPGRLLQDLRRRRADRGLPRRDESSERRQGVKTTMLLVLLLLLLLLLTPFQPRRVLPSPRASCSQRKRKPASSRPAPPLKRR